MGKASAQMHVSSSRGDCLSEECLKRKSSFEESIHSEPTAVDSLQDISRNTEPPHSDFQGSCGV